MKFLFVVAACFLLCPLFCSAQAPDFIVVKKHGKPVRNLLKGNIARFIISNSEQVLARIVDVHSDSLFFKEIIVRQLPTAWGVGRADTVATPIRGIHFKEITAVPKQKEGFTYVRNGSIFMVGAAGYVLVNVVNGAYLHYAPFGKKNRGGMIAAAGVFAGGWVLHKLYSPYYKIGKKYTIEYVKLAATSH